MYDITTLLFLWIVITILFGVYFIKVYTFWKRRNVPQASLLNTLKDITGAVFAAEPFSETWKRIYRRSRNYRYYGTYQLNSPILIIRDENLRKTLTIKDFEYFTDHRPLASKGSDPLWERNVFALNGEKWRIMRNTLNPTFTGSKMRLMFKIVVESVNKCMDNYKNLCKENKQDTKIEFKDSYTRLFNDITARCIFGVEVDSFKERENEFYLMGKESTAFGGFIRTIKFLLALTMPKIAEKIGVPFFTENVRRFFSNLVSRTIKFRQEQNVHSSDLISMMMQTRTKILNQEEELKQQQEQEISMGVNITTTENVTSNTVNYNSRTKLLTDEDIASQALLFLTGGFDTVASALSFLTYELAINPEIQQRLRQEILEHLNGDISNLTYESITKMKYFDMVVSESLRKWPPVLVVDRICTKDYIIKSENDKEKDVHLRQGQDIILPVFAIHHDAEIYPDPEKFDPERFNAENKDKINAFNYMPFGAGQRHCLGIRLALMEIKIVTAYLLCHFEVIPVKETLIPMRLQKSQLALNSENGFWLGLKPLQ